jgi:aspartyl-tRNA(Asn)/glutamyl-tRNA(Gln) amidotransferase subunit B
VQAHQLVDTPGLADYYEAAVALSGAPQATLNFVLGELSRLANESGTAVAAAQVTPQALAEIVDLTTRGAIGSKTAKDLMIRIWTEGGSPAEIVEREGLAQVSDPGAVDAFVREVIAAQPESVENFRNGKESVLKFLVGQVMKTSRGKADPQLAEERLRALIAEPNLSS